MQEAFLTVMLQQECDAMRYERTDTAQHRRRDATLAQK
jgi:hypothetical protein